MRPVAIVKTGLPAVRRGWRVVVLFNSGKAWETSGVPWGTEKMERLLVVATASKRLSASKASGGAGADERLAAGTSGIGMRERSCPDSASKRKTVVGIWKELKKLSAMGCWP